MFLSQPGPAPRPGAKCRKPYPINSNDWLARMSSSGCTSARRVPPNVLDDVSRLYPDVRSISHGTCPSPGCGETHAASRKIDPVALLGARLYPDMFPLTSQVQFAWVSQKAQQQVLPVLRYTHTRTTRSRSQSFGRASPKRSLSSIELVDASLIDGSRVGDIARLRISGGRALAFKGEAAISSGFAIPSMIFHVTAAYAILRHNGVEIGKASFLGQIPGV